MMEFTVKKLFIDVGPGTRNSEAWRKGKDFTIIGLEAGTGRYNNLKDVYPGKLLNVVVTDKDGEIECWDDADGIMLFMRESSMAQGNFKMVKKKTMKLDSLEWRDFDEIHIWADIEGAELLMLKGATEMLASGKVKWLNLEVRKNAPVEGWATAEQVYGFLDKYGFKPSVLLTQLHQSPHQICHKVKHEDVIFVPKFSERKL